MRHLLLTLCLLLTAHAAHAGKVDGKHVFGWIEHASLAPWGVTVKSKLDTGALTSSLHARDIERFEKDGAKWVRFTVDVEDQRTEKDVVREFERPLHRNVIIRGAGGEERRPVVLMNICFGDTVYEEQFSLENRQDMLYPVLIGRRTIQHLGLVDVKRTFMREPACDDDSEVMPFDPDDTDDDEGA